MCSHLTLRFKGTGMKWGRERNGNHEPDHSVRKRPIESIGTIDRPEAKSYGHAKKKG